MRIGIIGAGMIGSTMAKLWAAAGHTVMIASRHPDELAPLVEKLGRNTSAGAAVDAAAFGEAILLTVPLGASFSNAHAGAGVDYQFSRETERDLGGHLFRVNLSGAIGAFRLSGFGERQTQAPTARQIFTEIPWLQPLLDRLGLTANTPQQLADLLRTNAELSAYGYANSIQLDITPERSRVGATVAWSGTGALRPQLSLSTLFNRDVAVDRTSSGAVHSMSYSQRLDAATEMFVTWSALCHDHFLSSACQPAMFASLRRALNSGPAFLAPRGGRIDGVVFKDDKALGLYSSDLPPLADPRQRVPEWRRSRSSPPDQGGSPETLKQRRRDRDRWRARTRE